MNIDRDKLVDHINSKRSDLLRQTNESSNRIERLILLASHYTLLGLLKDIEKM